MTTHATIPGLCASTIWAAGRCLSGRLSTKNIVIGRTAIGIDEDIVSLCQLAHSIVGVWGPIDVGVVETGECAVGSLNHFHLCAGINS